jgi:putative FmdB family regulatory protein
VPIYEFRCRACRKKLTALVLSRERLGEVRCDRCGSADLDKLWSRFAAPKSEEARLEALADESLFASVDENDPASMARFVKKMGEAMGEDLSEEFEAALDEESRSPDDGEPASSSADGE